MNSEMQDYFSFIKMQARWQKNSINQIRALVVLFLLLVASLIYGMYVTLQLDNLRAHDLMIAAECKIVKTH